MLPMLPQTARAAVSANTLRPGHTRSVLNLVLSHNKERASSCRDGITCSSLSALHKVFSWFIERHTARRRTATLIFRLLPAILSAW